MRKLFMGVLLPMLCQISFAYADEGCSLSETKVKCEVSQSGGNRITLGPLGSSGGLVIHKTDCEQSWSMDQVTFSSGPVQVTLNPNDVNGRIVKSVSLDYGRTMTKVKSTKVVGAQSDTKKFSATNKEINLICTVSSFSVN